MTDNEIIEALECCGNDECSQCPLQDGVCSEKDLMKDALDLINRQKAEVEMWKKNCDELYEQMSERQKAEVEIAKKMGKAEAIKEFAERLNNELHKYRKQYKEVENFDGAAAMLIAKRGVEIILKEMVGDDG